MTGKHNILPGQAEEVSLDELPPDPLSRPPKKTSDLFPAVFAPEEDPDRPAVQTRWLAIYH